MSDAERIREYIRIADRFHRAHEFAKYRYWLLAAQRVRDQVSAQVAP